MATEAVVARPETRAAVRSVLSEMPEFRSMNADHRRDLARSLVRLCELARDLSDERDAAEHAARESGQPAPEVAAEPAEALAEQFAAGDQFSGGATRQLSETTRRVLDAVSFPRFVEELVNGVFKAMVGSSIKQMEAYVDLLDSVAGSGFEARNTGREHARAWLVEQFPGAYEMAGDAAAADDGWGDGGWGDDGSGGQAERTVRLRSGASAPDPEAIRNALGLDAGVSVQAGDPERLVPLVRQTLAAKRQSMLSTLLMLGLNRIVIESGKINASMRFHIDAQSAAREDRGSTFDFRNTTTGKGSFGVGAWGASASMTNTVGYVRTEQSQTTEELNTELDLNSSVEINFKSDYLPLNQLAGDRQVQQIRQQSRNPNASAPGADASRERAAARDRTDAARREAVSARIAVPGSQPAAPAKKTAAKKAVAKKTPAKKTAAKKAVAKKAVAKKAVAKKAVAKKTPAKKTAAKKTASKKAAAKKTVARPPTTS